MVTRAVQFVVSVDGASETGAAFLQMAQQEREAEKASRELKAQQQALTQGFSVVGQAIGQMGQAFGRTNQALGQMTTAIGQTVSALPGLIAQFGAAGVAIGAAQLALQAWSIYQQQEAQAAARRQADAQRLADTFETLTSRIREAEAAQQHFANVRSGQGSNEENQAFEQRLQHIGNLLVQARAGNQEALAQLGHTSLTPGGAPVLGAAAISRLQQVQGDVLTTGARRTRAANEIIAGPIAEIRSMLAEFRGNVGTAQEQRFAESMAGAAGIAADPNLAPDRRRGGPSRAEIERQRDLDYARANAAFNEEARRMDAEAANARIEDERHIQEAQAETERQRIDAAQERIRLDNEAHEHVLRQLEQEQRARDQAARDHAALVQQYQAITQPLVGSLVKSLGTVIAGSQSAGQAFEGLLSSFLQFISEQAALKAAFEFAEAIASFPNPATMASHAAAGIAFTAVAVAAGAGAVATAPQPPSGGPASPQRTAENDHGGASQITVIWNSPLITYGDTAEVGRSVGRTIARSDSRFASTV